MSADRIPRLARELLQEADAVACLPQATVGLLEDIRLKRNVRNRGQVVEAASLLVIAHQALGLKASDTPASVRLSPSIRCDVSSLEYFASPSRTPGQALCEHVRQALHLGRVPGPELAKVRVRATINPVTLESISLSPADFDLFQKATRCYGLAAARGDAQGEEMLHALRRGGPYVEGRLAPGVAIYYPPEDI